MAGGVTKGVPLFCRVESFGCAVCQASRLVAVGLSVPVEEKIGAPTLDGGSKGEASSRLLSC